LRSKRLKALTTFESGEIAQGFGTKKNRKKGGTKTKKKVEETKETKNSYDLTLLSDEEEKFTEAYKVRLQNKSEGDGILPDIREHLNQFSKVITWKQIGKKNIPEPVKGLCKEFDDANDNVERIKKEIQGCLTKARKTLQYPELKYATGSKRYRFEFELPHKLTQDLPEEFRFTTKSNKFKRYQTEELSELISQLTEAEDALKDAITPFLSKLFRKFYKKQYLWSAFVGCIAELDCIMSLAYVSKNEENMVKPVILSRKSSNNKA